MPALLETMLLDASGQMGLDEAILEQSPADSHVLRFYRWPAPAVTFGYSQPFAMAEAAARGRGIAEGQVVRRATGGGIVFHDGDLTFSLVFPWPRLLAPCSIYKNVHRAVHVGLKDADVASALWSPGGTRAAAGLKARCFSGPEPMDLVREDGRKVLGGALRKHGLRGLYQGSLRLDELGQPADLVENAVLSGLKQDWGFPLTLELDARWVLEGERAAVKYRSAAWNQRR